MPSNRSYYAQKAHRFLWPAAALLAATACASGPPQNGAKPSPQNVEGHSAKGPRAIARSLSYARRLKDAEGCQAAIPAYRAVAALGRGFEVAQYELGACLVTAVGATDIETGLYHEEALFWLKRAAHAGEPRAQKRLAQHLADPQRAHHAPKDSLYWALIYRDNPKTAMFGQPMHAETIIASVTSELSVEDLTAIEAHAAAFRPTFMAAYAAPAGQTARGERSATPEGKSRRRRRTP